MTQAEYEEILQKISKLPGNADQYLPENTEQLSGSPLQGKRLFFLGSSVTYGAAAKGYSFADYLQVRDQCVSIKEAVSGTTLTDDSDSSYVSRLNRTKRNQPVDVFVLQLSTNDAKQNKPLGKIIEDEKFDTHTIAGALEYCISFAKRTWNCPVVLYTNPFFESELYAEMVGLVPALKEKWHLAVLDFWHQEPINKDLYALYMADAIHPTMAGYREWWTPEFEKVLYELCI